MPRPSRTTKIFLYKTVIFVFFLGIIFFWIAHGEPIHDINIWQLEKNFYTQEIAHPNNSILLEKKKYLGGPSTHGDNRCVYAIGEVRTVPLSKEDIKRVYRDITIDFWNNRLPLNLLFADEYKGPYTLPFVDWQDELHDRPHSDTIKYIVYITTQRSVFFTDWRCDD